MEVTHCNLHFRQPWQRFSVTTPAENGPVKYAFKHPALLERRSMIRTITTTVFSMIAATSVAAEFRGISSGSIADSFPYQLSSPVVQVSTISGDGSLIGGSVIQTGVEFDCATFDCGRSAFVWSHGNSTRQPLGRLTIGPNTRAWPKSVAALSYDGSTALVSYEYRHYESGLHRDDSVTALRQSIEIGEWLTGFDMSTDASVVVGTLGEGPFRWTPDGGATGLSGIASDSGYDASAVSGDGSTIALNDLAFGGGFIAIDEERRNALRWTASDGPSELLPVEEAGYSYATAMSYDGSVIVGASESVDPLALSVATIWIGSQPMALESSGGASIALDISADAQTVVGSLDSTNPLTDAFFLPVAMLWRGGVSHRLEELLTDEYGLGDSIAGWSLTSATAISDDGTVIAGQGIAPNGEQAAWVVVLNVPEPSSCLMAAIAGLAFAVIAVGRHRG